MSPVDDYQPQVGDYVQVSSQLMFGVIEDIEAEGWYWIKLEPSGELYRATKFEIRRVAGL